MEKRLILSNNKKIAGVCGGIAEYLDIDPTVVRAIYAALTIFTAFCGVILYFILWAIIPNNDRLI